MPAAYPRERFVGKGLRVDAYAVYARIFGNFQLFFGECIGPAGLYGEFGRADIQGVDCGIYAGQLTFRHTERRAAANVYGVDFKVEGRKTFNLFYEAVCILLRILAHGGHRRGDERTVGTFCGAERNAHEDIGAPAPVFEVNFALGGKHGIGIVDIVENRVVGMKSRGVYETPGGTILMEAHQQLEELILDRDTYAVKKDMGNRMAQIVYEGKWFTPLREAVQAFVEKTQEYVTGEVKFKLYKGNIIKAGTTSPYSLYNESIASFTTGDLYDHHDAEGFINLFGLSCKVRAMKMQEAGKNPAQD